MFSARAKGPLSPIPIIPEIISHFRISIHLFPSLFRHLLKQSATAGTRSSIVFHTNRTDRPFAIFAAVRIDAIIANALMARLAGWHLANAAFAHVLLKAATLAGEPLHCDLFELAAGVLGFVRRTHGRIEAVLACVDSATVALVANVACAGRLATCRAFRIGEMDAA